MTRMFLSDASDSKLIVAGDYFSAESEEIFLRLRLHMLMLILFQRKLLISEGWALDSMPFIRVAAEVIRGIDDVKGQGLRSEALASFNPIVMEKRRPGDFRTVFQAYADREDVRWSGFMPYTNDHAVRLAISRGLRDSANNNVATPDAIARVFKEVMRNTLIPDDMADVARYFSDLPPGNNVRLLRVRPSPDAFQLGFNALLSAATRGPCTTVAEQALATAARSAIDQGRSFRTSSLAMQFAESHDDPSMQSALMKAINFTYMKVSSDAANAGMTTPAHDAGTFSEEMDRTLVDCFEGGRGGYDLFFINGYNNAHDLSRKIQAIKGENWRPIWMNTISLAISLEWRQGVTDFVRMISREGYVRAVQSKQYKNLETMLNRNVPELVLDYSPVHRLFGFRGSEKLRKAFPAASAAASGAVLVGLVSSISHSYGISSGVGGMAAGALSLGPLKFMETIIKEYYPDGLNIFSGTGIGAKRSSLLDPRIRR